MAVGLMQCFCADAAEAARDYSELASLLGLYFQIRDDYINLCSADYHRKKDFCEDLTEGTALQRCCCSGGRCRTMKVERSKETERR